MAVLCAKFQNNPGIKHIEAALRILVYLKHHPDWGLLYTSTGKKPGEVWELEMYVDSDHVSDPDYRRSRTGFIVKANKQNLVDFGTAMQARTATSTPVAEYVELASGLKQLLWIKQIIEECGVEVDSDARRRGQPDLYCRCQKPNGAKTYETHGYQAAFHT